MWVREYECMCLSTVHPQGQQQQDERQEENWAPDIWLCMLPGLLKASVIHTRAHTHTRHTLIYSHQSLSCHNTHTQKCYPVLGKCMQATWLCVILERLPACPKPRELFHVSLRGDGGHLLIHSLSGDSKNYYIISVPKKVIKVHVYTIVKTKFDLV